MRSNCRTRTTHILAHVGLLGVWRTGDHPAALLSERTAPIRRSAHRRIGAAELRYTSIRRFLKDVARLYR
jgi:hypothetical protein